MVAICLAFGASVAWGASDFLGGLAARRLPVLLVLVVAQAAALPLCAGVWLVAGADVPPASAALAASLAALAELAGFACLYRGMAAGALCVVAPLASLTAVLPVVVHLGRGAALSAPEVAGAAVALVGTALTAAEPGGRRLAAGAGWGLGAAACFGVFLLALGDASDGGAPAAVLCGRLVSVGLLALVVAALRPGRSGLGGLLLALAALGALDAGANLAYASAAAGGGDAVVAVLGSLYPLTTVLLARAVLGERLGAVRAVGVTLVFAGVGLLSAGSLAGG